MRIPATGWLGAALMTGLGLYGGTAGASDWHRYENAHFIAWSNAREQQVRDLLEELERFRAAVLQVGNIEIPAGAPKTVVVITRSAREFNELRTGRNVAGFALRDGERTLIVMPATGNSRVVIRHEYAHALLNYKSIRYPAWYEEGFAELLSATEFVDRGEAFTVGTVTERARNNGPPVYDWNELVAERFRLHETTSRRLASSAYAQAWLLAHWATLGDNTRNAVKLQRYLDLLEDGRPSGEAFVQAFGARPAELWSGELRRYSRSVPAFKVRFRPDHLDTAFVRTPAPETEHLGALEYLQLRARALTPARPPPDALAQLPGTWDWLEPEGSCTAPMKLSLREEARTLVLSRPGGDAHPPAAGSYRVERQDPGSLRLLAGASPAAWDVEFRGRDLLCWRPADREDIRCSRILRRCPEGS